MERESGDRGPETWERFIDDCVARFHAATSLEEKSAVLVRIGHVLRSELGDDEQGFDAVLEAFRLDPSNDEAVAELAALARGLGRWTQVIDAIRGFVDAEEDPRRRIQLCEHAARWCKEGAAALGSSAADPFVVEIDRIDPSHWAVRRRMASIYREQGIWDLRREELERALLRADGNDEVRDTRFALGELHELRLGDLERATVHYEAALACAPQSRDVLRALVRVYEGRELHDRMRDTLAVLVALVPDAADKHALLLQLAEVWATRFLKPGHAAPLLEEALALAPTDAQALTLERLEHCYRALRAWPEYVRTLERQVELLASRRERATALVRIGQVFESALHDAPKALGAYRRACTADPQLASALTELARLSERSDDWRGAADCREKLAALAAEPGERAKLHVSIGALLEPPNRDPDRARAQYERATKIDPRLSAAWEGLQRLAEQEGDYATAAHYLTERLARAAGRRAKARLFGELGLLWERAGSNANAIEAYETAHTITPGSVPVAHDLLRLYRDSRMTAKAARLCTPLLRAAMTDGDAARAIEVLRAGATVAGSTDDPGSLLTQGSRAVARFPDVPAMALVLIDLGHALKDRTDAAVPLHAALEAISIDSRTFPVATLVKLGEILWALGEIDRGIDLFVEALAIDDACVPALHNLVEHFVAAEDLQRSSSYRLWLARVTSDRRVRFTLLLETANDLFDAGGDLEQAAWVFEEARAIEPRYRVLLDRLVSIYTALGDWRRLLDVQRAIADSEEILALRASRLRSMAAVARSKLGDARAAVALFEEALDLDPTRLDALEELAAICKQERDYDRLARAHGRLIIRAEALGLRPCEPHPTASAASVECPPSSVRPARTEGSGVVPLDSMERSARLESDARVRQLRGRIAASPLSAAAHRDLCAEFRMMPATDAAWCVYSVLQHLRGADDEAERFARRLGSPELSAASGALNEADWYAGLLHPGLDRPLLAAMALASSAARRPAGNDRNTRSSEPLSAKGTSKGARLVGLVRDAARILRLPEPTLWELPTDGAPLRVAPGVAPELHVSFAALEALPAGSLPFVAGRALAELHPLLAVRSAFRTPSELRSLFAAAVRATSGDATVVERAARSADTPSADDDASAALRAALSEQETRELAISVAMALDRPGAPDFDRLHYLLDVSAMRAGMLLQGAVDRAWAVIVRERRLSCELPGTELREELVTFAVSAEHMSMRDRAGLTVRAVRGFDENPRRRSATR